MLHDIPVRRWFLTSHDTRADMHVHHDQPPLYTVLIYLPVHAFLHRSHNNDSDEAIEPRPSQCF
jgi:hypothetical protein